MSGQDTVAESRVPAKSRFWQSVVETYFTRILLIGIGFLTTVVVSRELGPAGRGVFAVATAITAIGVQFGNLGLQASNTYYVAKDRGLLPVLIGNTLAVSFGVGGVVALVGWIVDMNWPQFVPVHGILLILALGWIPFSLGLMLLQNLLLGIDCVRSYNGTEMASKVLGLALIGLAILSRRITPEVMYAATSGGIILSFLWILVRLRGLHTGPLSFSLRVFQEHVGLGIKAYLIAFFGFLVLRIDLVMVKYMLGAQAAGYYSISEILAENMLTLPIVIGVILFPKLSGMTDNRQKLLLTKKAALIAAGLMAPLMGLTSFLAKPLIQFVFGASFAPAAGPFLWLMPGSFLLGVQVVIVQYLNSFGFPKIIAYSWFVVTALNVGLNLWAIPAYGITGAAVVSTVSYSLIFVLVLSVIYFRNGSEQLAVTSEVPQYIA